MFLFTCESKTESDSRKSQCDGDDGYMFEPTQSDDDAAGHVRRAGDLEEAFRRAGFCRLKVVGDESLGLDRMVDMLCTCRLSSSAFNDIISS